MTITYFTTKWRTPPCGALLYLSYKCMYIQIGNPQDLEYLNNALRIINNIKYLYLTMTYLTAH
jgi:hypothetical protein